MIRTHLLLFSIIISALLLNSCTCSRNDNKPVSTEPSTTPIIQIQRLEKELFTLNIDSIDKYVPKLSSKYGEFFDLYNYKIIQLGNSNDPSYPDRLKGFITDYFMNLNYTRVMEVFPDVNDIQTSLDKAFKNYQEFFPGKRIPHVYTCISGWNQSVFTADTLLGIALDKYLGRESPFYEKLELPLYARYNMQREYIVPDCMRAWGYTQFELKDSASNVLSNLLYEGKIVFFMKKMLPEMHDSIIMGFRPDQLKWCENNLKQMWTYLAEHKLLFSSDFLTIRKLFYPAPFTSFYTSESPGRASVWLGYKIISAYMENNKNVSLPQLMSDSEYQKILKNSKFNP